VSQWTKELDNIGIQ